VLYEAISGRTPFKGANYNALLRQIVEDTPPTLLELSSGDAQLSAIVARSLSKQPDQRHISMGELGRALAEWLIAQGVSEDICGTTLETKWLRGNDVSGRAGRATFTSISDAWPSEKGSGVRRNLPEAVNTLPAPPRPEVEDLQASEPAPPPNRRPKWPILAGIAVLLAVGVAWGLVRLSSAPAPSAESAGSAAPDPVPGTAVPPAGTSVEEAPAPAAAAPTPAVTESAAQPPPEPVSSKVGRASGASAHGGKPAPVRPKKGAGSVGKAKAKPGDLLSPY
jgi:hypothetical protein